MSFPPTAERHSTVVPPGGFAGADYPSTVTPAAATRPRLLRQVLTIAFVTVGVAAAVVVIWLRRDDVGEALSKLSVLAAVGSFVAGTAASYATMLAWRALLADFGTPLPLTAAGRVFFLGQLGKYLPGSIWPVMAQMELGREYGVRRANSGAAATLMLVLAAVTGTGVAAAILPLASDGLLAEYRWVALAAVALLAFLHPQVQQWLAALAGRLIRRGLALPRSSARGMAIAGLWMMAAWALFGLHLHLLVASTCSCDTSPLLNIGIFALAWVSGFLFVIAPAGAGVREGVLVLGLASVLDPAAALLVALISRVLLTVTDLGLAAAGVLAARRRRGGVGTAAR